VPGPLQYPRQVEKEKDALRMELTKARAQIGEADAAIGAQKSELDKLKAVVVEADAERLRQRKEYDLVGACGRVLGISKDDDLHREKMWAAVAGLSDHTCVA
jgi:hypothetical protein